MSDEDLSMNSTEDSNVIEGAVWMAFIADTALTLAIFN